MNIKFQSIKIATLLALPAVMMTACKKDFLEVDPQGQLTEEQVLTDPAAAARLVTGVYNTLYFGGFGNNTVGVLWHFAGDMTSDNSDKGSTPDDYNDGKPLDNLTFAPGDAVFNNLWRGHYQGIARASKAITILNESTFDETVKNRLIGEVRFIRALYYFNMVRMFGGVPLILEVPNATEADNPIYRTRATKEAVYQAIEDDLNFAITNLVEKGETGTQTGRANKGAAQSLLAKVHLYQGEWQQAYDLAKAVITSNDYDLAADYPSLFRETGENNIESVFEVNTGPARNAGNCTAVSQIFSNAQGPRGKGGWNDLGFGLNTPSSDLASAYEAGDTRRSGTIIFINPTVPNNSTGTVLWDGYRIPSQDSVENPRYSYKAYHSSIAETPSCFGPTDKDWKPKNIRIIRFAEVLLIGAEAATHVGQAGDALTWLTRVRARANLTTTTATEADIWKERRVELAMEGDRYFDLVRTGQAEAVMTAHGKPFTVNKHELFPIPQAQRDLSGGLLTQNPGYPQ